MFLEFFCVPFWGFCVRLAWVRVRVRARVCMRDFAVKRPCERGFRTFGLEIRRRFYRTAYFSLKVNASSA